MRSFARFLPRISLAAGTALSIYGGYGAGVGHAAGGGLAHWLQVAALATGGLGLAGLGLWKVPRPAGETPPSFAADLAALERLVPTVRKHPDGLSALQDLIDVVFEACHRPDVLRKRETLVEKGGRGDG